MNDKVYIYALQHNVTKKIYVGGTKDLRQRYLAHILELKRGKHHSKNLQRDFDEYGEDFSLYVLEEVIKERIPHPFIKYQTINSNLKAEYDWMIKYNTLDDDGYNSQDVQAKWHRDKSREKYIPFKDGLPIL